jgi:hypothetical protein
VAHRRRRVDKRGGPRRADAKRRRTTLSGRAPERDLGSPELVVRKARAGNGGAAPVELIDVPDILLAHHLIEAEEWGALRLLAAWLQQVRRGLGLRQTSVTGLWAAPCSRPGPVAIAPCSA